MRGIVLCPNARPTSATGFVVHGGTDSITIRRAAMYWDRIDNPTSNAVHIALSKDEELLLQAGVLQRTTFNVMHGGGIVSASDVMFAPPVWALREHHVKEPGQWALGQSGVRLDIAASESKQTRALEVDLYQALPVPAADVPIDDILQFKSRRKDELGAFRGAMDKLYERATIAPDSLRANDSVLSEIERELSTVNRVVSETRWKRIMTSLKVDISLKDLAIGAAAIGAAHFHQALTPIADGLAAIKIGSVITAGLKDPIPGLNEYAYLGYIARDIATAPSEGSKTPGITMKGGPSAQFARSTIGRNDPCYCGSGRKYKKCHGSSVQ